MEQSAVGLVLRWECPGASLGTWEVSQGLIQHCGSHSPLVGEPEMSLGAFKGSLMVSGTLSDPASHPIRRDENSKASM